jgi:hypothetical protein
MQILEHLFFWGVIDITKHQPDDGKDKNTNRKKGIINKKIIRSGIFCFCKRKHSATT